MGQVSKHLLKTAARYRRRIDKGDYIVRHADGRMFWQSNGRPAGAKTVKHMIERRELFERDTDIFGDFSHGQTVGRELRNG